MCVQRVGRVLSRGSDPNTLCQRYAGKVLVCVTGCYVIANMEVGPISIYCLETSGGGANYHFLSSSNFEIFSFP